MFAYAYARLRPNPPTWPIAAYSIRDRCGRPSLLWGQGKCGEGHGMVKGWCRHKNNLVRFGHRDYCTWLGTWLRGQICTYLQTFTEWWSKGSDELSSKDRVWSNWCNKTWILKFCIICPLVRVEFAELRAIQILFFFLPQSSTLWWLNEPLRLIAYTAMNSDE